METTDMKNILQKLTESFSQNATIKKVYGEPITAQGKTIITVAKVAQGFGGGFGSKNGAADASAANAAAGKSKEAADQAGEGGGIGGGLAVKPIGFIEITESRTRFIRFDVSRYIALGTVLGLALSFLWGKKRYLGKKKKKK